MTGVAASVLQVPADLCLALRIPIGASVGELPLCSANVNVHLPGMEVTHLKTRTHVSWLSGGRRVRASIQRPRWNRPAVNDVIPVRIGPWHVEFETFSDQVSGEVRVMVPALFAHALASLPDSAWKNVVPATRPPGCSEASKDQPADFGRVRLPDGRVLEGFRAILNHPNVDITGPDGAIKRLASYKASGGVGLPLRYDGDTGYLITLDGGREWLLMLPAAAKDASGYLNNAVCHGSN